MNTSSISILREICRLLLSTKLSINEIARILNTSARRVKRIKNRIEKLALIWSQIELSGDKDLLRQLYPSRKVRYVRRAPNWAEINQKMCTPHQTLIQAWEEYRFINPADAYSYSQFTYHYAKYIKTIDITMRQTHYPGEVIFVDFAGKTIPFLDKKVERKAHIFVAVSGASNYTFAFACSDQSLQSWIHVHNKMFEFYGGVHHAIVPDNLKAAVTSAGKFPVLNRTYLELARHYDTYVAPTRVRRPQDKGKVEAGVLFVSRWITAPLLRRKFFSLEEINQAIAELLPALNERKFKRLPGCRYSRFLELDKPALKPLPAKPFEFVNWIPAQKVGSDYHVYVDDHAYSVPYSIVGQMVEACYSHTSVQFFHDNQRIATHKRSFEKGGRTLDKSHMTKAHQMYSERSMGDFLLWAKDIGVYAISAIEAQFENKPQHSYAAAVACDKLKKLASLYGNGRFEAACHRACLLHSLSVKTIRSILSRNTDALELPESLPENNFPVHQNLRGADYYSVGAM
jgi:transposase